jgi:ferredoxin
MNEHVLHSGIAYSARTADGQARAAALNAGAAIEPAPTSLVSYQSRGTLLIVGPEQAAIAAAERLAQMNRTVVITAASSGARALESDPERGLVVVRGRLAALGGHLGGFTATLEGPNGLVDLAQLNGTGRPAFDLVLDLGTPPTWQREMQPFGYYAPGEDAQALEDMLAELPAMRGEFEKPKYFEYNAEICAHGSSGLKGCTRCLQVCPAWAISSIGEQIAVDPYLCQGGGSCATACPTGALTYVYPRPSDTLDAVRAMLKAYREAGGTGASLLFYDSEGGLERLQRIGPELPEHVLPVQLEEVASIGMDAWLTCLAYGASEVLLLRHEGVASGAAAEVDRQLEYTWALLEGMGYARERLRWVGGEDADILAALAAAAPPAQAAAGFATFNDKRGTLRFALDHLYAHAPAPRAEVELPQGAPFGEVRVDTGACTLCMACPSVCPTHALTDGTDAPRLSFTEELCVQCGLCATACPENAITLRTRYLYDYEQRGATRVLKEEPPFCCITCGKPFATASVIERMTERLRGHHMFQGEAALRRLRMCEDCRVKDMYTAEGALDRGVM